MAAGVARAARSVGPGLVGLVGAVSIAMAGPARAGGDCSRTSVGFLPLTDLGADLYQGYEGGLYPGGENRRPPPHEAAGVAIAAQVTPLDGSGAPDPNGVIGLMSIGMSNATQEWQVFIDLAAQDAAIDPSVAIVDGAEGGRDARDVADPASTYWSTTIPSRLALAGITAAQVQVIWLKEAVGGPTDPFPDHALELRDLLASIVQIAQDTFPNLRIAYLSSRTYAGYATSNLNPEPYAYEQAFAVKWLIEAQLGGDPALNYDPALGPVKAPWLSWGTYLWADGLLPRSDGRTWECDDFSSDGVHPARPGREKVARDLLHHFESDVTATPWFLDSGAGDCGAPAEVDVYGHGTTGSQGVPRLALTELPTIPTAAPLGVDLLLARASSPGLLVFGLASFDDGEVPYGGGSLLVQPWVVVPIATDLAGAFALELGDVPDDPALCGFELFVQGIVADPLGPTGRVALTPGLSLLLGD